MKILRETMRRYTVGSYVVRIWREADPDAAPNPFADGDVLSLLRFDLHRPEDCLNLAKTLLALSHVNAVEIINGNGNGDVLYRTQEIAIGGRTFQVI